MQMEEYPVPNEANRARQFVLIPAAILDDRRIKAAEKIFFAEIMALSNNTGYCYATNTYFRTLYGVSVTTLQGWLANLKTCGYIKIDVIRNPDNSVKERRITPYCLDFAPYGENLGESPEILGEPSPENLLNPPPKNRQENNTILNNTSKNKRESTREARPKSIEDVRAYCRERNNSVNVDKWYAHYESIGWKVGRNPMKDWKAAVRKWEADDGCGPKAKGGTQPHASKFAEDFV